MMPALLRLAIVVPLLLAACAVAPPSIESGKLREVRDQPLLPYEIHEDCVAMVSGDRLEYSFKTQASVAFNIHYHEGKVVVMPVTRTSVQQDEGKFEPLTAQDYCLMWEAGVVDTMLEYRVQLIRAKPPSISR